MQPLPTDEADRHRIPEPSERYYLFSLTLPRWFKGGELVHYNGFSAKAMMNADFAFVRQSDETVDYVEFQVVKNRAGIPFNYTPEFAWLKRQYPSLTYYHGLLQTGSKSGILRITDGRDLLLIKVMHGPETCERRNEHTYPR